MPTSNKAPLRVVFCWRAEPPGQTIPTRDDTHWHGTYEITRNCYTDHRWYLNEMDPTEAAQCKKSVEDFKARYQQ